MSDTSQPITFGELYTDLQNRVRVQPGTKATADQAKRMVNIGLQDMHIGYGEKFPWAERSAILVTQAPYTTGTLTATQGSAALTGASTLWGTDNVFAVANVRVGGKFVIAGGTEVYEVRERASDTTVTLTSPYTQTTVAGASYEYFEDSYGLHDDFLRPLDQTFFDEHSDIPLIGRREFRLRYPRNKVPGKPRVATLVQGGFVNSVSSTSELGVLVLGRSLLGSSLSQRRLVFWKPPDDFYSIKYYFVTNKLAFNVDGTAQIAMSDDADEPIVPLQYRHLIVLYGLYNWYRDKKNDTRSAAVKSEYLELLSRIVGDSDIGARRPQFQPRVSVYKSPARRPYRGSGRRFVTGDRFDQLR